MLSRKMILACLSLAVLQMAAALSFMAGASAQADQLVAVVIGEKNREACEVQSRISNDGNWGAQTLDGPPVACEGGS